MKRVLFFLLFGCLLAGASAQEHRRYIMVWNDEFDSGVLDETVWSKIPRSTPNWAVHMSKDERLYAFDNGDLVLRGIVNDDLAHDTATYLTGGIWSRGKKTFGFGRIEVKAKFDVAQGYWPAIWMLPTTNNTLKWPHGGEIDIMEHFGYAPYVNHTVHTHYTHNLGRRRRPPYVAYPFYNAAQYNTYAVERFHDSLVFFVNGNRTFNYPRYRDGRNEQFPFDQHGFYLILDVQIGLDGSPSVDTDRLPVELRIDHVRYYELDTKTDVIPEPQVFQQTGTRRFKYRKMVVNTKETFDDPDEYHIIVKRGKAKVSGNVEWAKNTLTQLVGEDGKIANLEIHDKPATSYRGVCIDGLGKKPTVEEVVSLMEKMTFYKLNYLQWNGDRSFSEGDAKSLSEQARKKGIVIVNTVSRKGEWLNLQGEEPDMEEAMMVFAEKCWRGVELNESQLANTKEKIAIQRNRFPLK